ncbi:gastrin/cholecystokinin type B receptor-like [Saccostrea echinata]|uniref:gastrin/cholecystokinin type B receptor-like n=1 Tax=Saccostrea echinata TaxID=191078 RepID=UPI002A7F8F6E|nr:gastrin/cholecystokinin type B receptor-like [Saccostrea echinata]
MDNATYISEKLEKWNRELTESLILNDVILSLYMIMGLLGNSTVIIIYGFMMKGNKEERYFIPFLAVVDLCGCLVSSSSAIALNMMQATFYNIYACKAVHFLTMFLTFTSGLFLLIIAVHRYLKIRKPFGKQMTLKWKQFAMCLSLITALTSSLPMIYFFGLVPFPNTKEGIIGWRCSRLKSANKTLSLIFGTFVVIATVTVMLSLLILYSKIGYTILQHFNITNDKNKSCSEAEITDVDQFQKKISTQDDPLSAKDNKNHPIQLDSIKVTGYNSSETDDTRLSGMNSPETSAKTTQKISIKITTYRGNTNQHDSKSSVIQRKNKQNRRVVYKLTLMFMLITVIFLICFIPKVIIMLLEARNPKFLEELLDSARAGISFVSRMYIINYITNPFIYAFLDNKFACEVKKLFDKCRGK